MSYTGKFDYDIFISFAASDNQDGWVSIFVKNLEFVMNKLGPRKIIFWSNVDASDRPEDSRISNSAIFLCIETPTWLASERCRDALEKFKAAAVHNSRVPVTRVFKAVKEPELISINGSARRSVLDEITGVNFYRRSPIPHALSSNDKEYEERLSDLGSILFGTLDALKSGGFYDHPRESETFDIVFSPELSDYEIKTSFAALADYYRACGGVGLSVEHELEEVIYHESVNV